MSNSNKSQSFSSFADLKDLQDSLRRKEAEEAKQKADAIIVDASVEHLNPLKQKAARLATFTAPALEQEKFKREQQTSQKAPKQNTRTNDSSSTSSHNNATFSQSAQLGRNKQDTKTQHDLRGESASARRERKGDESKKLDRALSKLARKADAMREASHASNSTRPKANISSNQKHNSKHNLQHNQNHNIKDKLKDNPKDNPKSDNRSLFKEHAQNNHHEHKVNAHDTKNQSAKPQKNKSSSKSKAKANLLLKGKHFDSETCSYVLERLDSVRYQTKRIALNRLAELDSAMQKCAIRLANENEAIYSMPQTELVDLIVCDDAIAKQREAIVSFIDEEVLKLSLRIDSVPDLSYPEHLPVSARHDEIVATIMNNQVIIIAGETGSGKTTQIPKMCLEAGLGRKGLIGHTQPRRLAAHAVASRIAEELKEELGKSVSYRVRFTDVGSPDSYIKLMTDGILLSELANDRLLLNYEAIIIDEAHERSLNIDFLLGYLKGVLTKRPELKLIITSATIDVERFSAHFNNAPIIEVSGRTYPVEVVYMPLLDDGKGVYIEAHDGSGSYVKQISKTFEQDGFAVGKEDPELSDGPGAWRDYKYESVGGSKEQLVKASTARSAYNYTDDNDAPDILDVRQGILQAIHYLEKRGRGDILVFLPGERDILEVAQFLRKANLRDTEIIPLYARLATAEQHKIFTEHTGMRIVLSTNVAETSLTVPGIRYVIDPGLARISRYSARTKVQRLPIERISQASANQRKGRCGRVSDGICVRLYSKEDFDNRPEFTDPEILRTNLASVLLQMASLRLGRIENFPFIDAPAPRQVSDGLRLLDELGATYQGKGHSRHNDEDCLRLTEIGRAIARLPCDPRLGRMLVEANKYHSLHEVLIIVSALAVMDPREYPLDKKEAATEAHKRFNDEKSDFIAFIKLHDYLKELQESLSKSAYRKRLKQEFLSYIRVREWFDVLRQLRISMQSLNFKVNEEPADYESIHRALVAGLLSHLGMIEPNGNNFIGARGARFVVFPASGLAKKPPKWLCVAELAETSRLFARTVASIDPSYAEAAAPHLIKNTYNEPHWSKKNGAVMAFLTRTIYGLPIVQRRLVQYKDVDPSLCHELFIRDGLVAGNIECRHRFFKHNLSLIDDVEYLEDKVRRRDLLADSQTLEFFYQERIPSHINNMRDFDKWWKDKSKTEANYLDFSYELVAKQDVMAIQDSLYPEFWKQGDLRFKLSYVFDLGSERDGVTVHIPITVINQVRHEDFLWQIDGLRKDLFASLIKSLPKRLRRNLIPAPEYAKALEESLSSNILLLNKSTVELETLEREGLLAKSKTNKSSAKSSAQANNTKVNASLAQVQTSSSASVNLRYACDNLFVAVAKELTRLGGELITIEDFDKSIIEPYLFMNFLIEGIDGQEIAYGKDFIALSARLQNKAREVLHQVVKIHQVTAPAQSWEYGTIKQEQISQQGSLKITAYPALTDRGDGVTLELYDSKERQLKAMQQGAIKLIALSLKTPTAYLETHLPNRSKLSMYYQPLGSIKELIFDLMLCAISNIVERNGGVPWDEQNFNRLKEIVRGELNTEALEVAKIVEQSLVKAHKLKRLLKGNISFELARSYSDVANQLDSLVYKGFISSSGMEHLKELPRYLDAAIERIARINRDIVRDQMYLRTLDNIQDEYQKVLKSYHKDLTPKPLLDVKWMIEELRVSYFAQQLGVIGPISDKRIFSELSRIQKEWPPQK